MDTLRLVLQDEQFCDDMNYEGLLDFQEEVGPASALLIRRIGATEDTILSLPLQKLEEGHHLLESEIASFNRPAQCSICIEEF
jgi:hypothetical protein